MISILEQGFIRPGFNNPNRVNAPTFIHKIINPDSNMFLPGRGANHAQKNISGVPIDKDIPEDSFNKLNGMKQIELRSSCQGGDEDHPTFLIFRSKSNPNDESIAKSITDRINNAKNNLVADYNLGNDNKYRIGVTSKNVWSGQPGYDEFWNDLPDTIKNAVS